jgi:hypothetical protein
VKITVEPRLLDALEAYMSRTQEYLRRDKEFTPPWRTSLRFPEVVEGASETEGYSIPPNLDLVVDRVEPSVGIISGTF